MLSLFREKNAPTPFACVFPSRLLAARAPANDSFFAELFAAPAPRVVGPPRGPSAVAEPSFGDRVREALLDDKKRKAQEHQLDPQRTKKNKTDKAAKTKTDKKKKKHKKKKKKKEKKQKKDAKKTKSHKKTKHGDDDDDDSSSSDDSDDSDDDSA